MIETPSINLKKKHLNSGFFSSSGSINDTYYEHKHMKYTLKAINGDLYTM